MKLNGITNNKKSIATELRSIIDQVKNLDYENKDMQSEIISITVSYTKFTNLFCRTNMMKS
jgi:uncharacterized protein (UPF0335 family)